jgi:hypothetical protein
VAATTGGSAVSVRSYPPSRQGGAKCGSEEWAERRTTDEIVNRAISHGQVGRRQGPPVPVDDLARPVLFSYEQTENMGAQMVPALCGPIEDLGSGDLVKVDCAACEYTALLAPAFLGASRRCVCQIEALRLSVGVFSPRVAFLARVIDRRVV